EIIWRASPPVLVFPHLQFRCRVAGEAFPWPYAAQLLFELVAILLGVSQSKELRRREENEHIFGLMGLGPLERRFGAFLKLAGPIFVERSDKTRCLREQCRSSGGDIRIASECPIRQRILVGQVDTHGMSVALHATADSSVAFLELF